MASSDILLPEILSTLGFPAIKTPARMTIRITSIYVRGGGGDTAGLGLSRGVTERGVGIVPRFLKNTKGFPF